MVLKHDFNKVLKYNYLNKLITELATELTL